MGSPVQNFADPTEAAAKDAGTIVAGKGITFNPPAGTFAVEQTASADAENVEASAERGSAGDAQ